MKTKTLFDHIKQITNVQNQHYWENITDADKQLFDDTDKLDFVARNNINIKDNVSKYQYSDEVNELYQDSIDYDRHKVSFARTEMTNQY